MDFTALQTELFARGFDYLNDAGTGLGRAKRWINDAYHEICEAEDWPFLVTTATGNAPLTISDARKFLAVVDTTQTITLAGTTQRALLRVYSSTTTAGTPEFWWFDQSTARVYPTATNALAVTYIKFPADLSAGGDTPVVPTRYHELLVHGAVRRAYLDSDNINEAQGVDQELQKGIQEMRTALLRPEPGRDNYGPHQEPLLPGEATE